MRLENKVAIVTGGGRAMGRGYAEGLAREGAAVLVTDVDFEAAEAVAKGIQDRGGVAAAARCDVADDDQVQAAASVAVEKFGGIDILVNNAGLHLRKWNGPFSSKTLAEVRTLFDVNVLGVVSTTQACRASMTERGGGAIVNISSTSSYSSHSPYGVTKLAVRGLTVAFARELGPSGIRVNGIAPGHVDSDSVRAEFTEEEVLVSLRRPQVLDRLVEVSDVVEAMLFLVSDEARTITGETIKVSGGSVLLP